MLFKSNVNYLLMSLVLEINNCLLVNQRQDIPQITCGKLISHQPYGLAWVGLTELDGTVKINAFASKGAIYLQEKSFRWDSDDNPIAICLKNLTPICINGKHVHQKYGLEWEQFTAQTNSSSVLIQPLFQEKKGYVTINY